MEFRLSILPRIASSVIVVAICLPAPGFANPDPLKVVPVAAEETASENAGAFVCGTYKGNEAESRLFHHIYQSRLEKGVQATASTADFVVDDVWVVEDDGTLLISGLNSFDTDSQTIRFTPNGSSGYDATSTAYSFDAVFGVNIGLGDDSNSTEALLFPFGYFGTAWTDVHVNANGAVSFGADVNPSGFFNSDDFFSLTPKIAAFMIDLNPDAGGAVYHKQEATQSTFTWNSVLEFGTANSNTVQLVLRDDGSFDLTFAGIVSTVPANGFGAVGIHPGGTPVMNAVAFSDDLPFFGGAGEGIYELYHNIANPLVNEVALLQRFYQTYPDDFFQIVFFTNFTQTMSGFANERNIENSVTGIGLPVFDNSQLYGSSGVLESRCNMNRLGVWPADAATRFTGDGNSFLTIMGQEAGHRWGAFINFEDSMGNPSNLILGRSDAHWSYYVDVDHSSLEGGNWEFVSGDTFITPTLIDHFGDIDEYTFGLRTPEEVSETFFVSSPTNDLPANRSVGTPPQGALATGAPVTVTIQDIINAEGPRLPAEPDEDKDLRQAFILLVQNGTTPSQPELDQIAGFRSAWEDYFEVSVDGRFAVNTSITTTPPVGVIKGLVTDAVSGLPVDDCTAISLERQFNQFVPGGGRYTFRYMAPSLAEAAESVTIDFTAPGYDPFILATTVPYDSVVCVDVALQPAATTGLGDHIGTPVTRPTLRSIVPNPAGARTTVSYALPREERVNLSIFDLQGRRIRRLVNRMETPGDHHVVWNGVNDRGQRTRNGVYFVRLEAGDRVQTRKLVLAEGP